MCVCVCVCFGVGRCVSEVTEVAGNEEEEGKKNVEDNEDQEEGKEKDKDDKEEEEGSQAAEGNPAAEGGDADEDEEEDPDKDGRKSEAAGADEDQDKNVGADETAVTCGANEVRPCGNRQGACWQVCAGALHRPVCPQCSSLCPGDLAADGRPGSVERRPEMRRNDRPSVRQRLHALANGQAADRVRKAGAQHSMAVDM